MSPSGFLLNGKPITLTCGLMYYFRIHPAYWRDRLKKLRATGAIAVKIMVPWNLHEPYKDVYDFGNNSSEMSQFLDVVKFIQIAKQEDLLVLVGLGPYINADVDLGGLPSYLIGERIKIRTSQSEFLARVDRFFKLLLDHLKPLQIECGGPIIMFQLENSYGIVRENEGDDQYMVDLKTIVEQNGIKSLLFTSDSISATMDRRSLSHLGVLQTTNSETDVLAQLETLQTLYPHRPKMVHLRTGFLDHWDRPQHNSWLAHEFEAALNEAINFPASVSLHVFHGGTNFGFTSGVTCVDTPDSYHPQITSYDYDAPLTEAGDYTQKYSIVLEVFRSVHPSLYHPPPPASSPRTLSLSLPLTAELPWRDIVQQLPQQITETSHFVHLEDLPAVDGQRQSHGYVLYSFRIRVSSKCRMKIFGRKRDIVMVLLDGKLISPSDITETNHFGFWDSDLDELDCPSHPGTYLMELLVENCGRLSFADSLEWMTEKKGMGPENRVVFKNAVPASKINITGMPFLSSWVSSLTGWNSRISYETKPAPSFVRTTFELTREEITDTFLEIGDWRKGFVMVNGFNIGRYFCNSPQQVLFVPAPLLKPGKNTVIIFEHYFNPMLMKFRTEPLFV
ncbi:beta-galactosidase-1-like protein 3 isoform X1 [Macrosteles quadrilineatus]|uniref:beta-galactosidase-1-like protein 3 isoform X1 n=1 Tax=Macrosteles quadrilineatus TaxID=74068 RepID=UPI0023E0D076|nr:beta-galactosidase-1-like protein 3 isoform X1 [Macrosteles quadrilineatus]